MIGILRDFSSDVHCQILALSTFNEMFSIEHHLTEDMTEGLRYQISFEKNGGLDFLEEL